MRISWQHNDKPEILIRFEGQSFLFKHLGKNLHRVTLCCSAVASKYVPGRCPSCSGPSHGVEPDDIYGNVTAIMAGLSSHLSIFDRLAYGALVDSQFEQGEAIDFQSFNGDKAIQTLVAFNREIKEFSASLGHVYV